MLSAIHQHESAIGVHVPPSSKTSLLLPSPSHSSRLPQTTSFRLPVSRSKFLLAIYSTYGNIYVSVLLSLKSSLLLSPPLCLKVYSLCLHLHCCPVDRFIGTNLLDFIYTYIYVYNICLSDLLHFV